jgi:hypothetical protein
MRRFDIGPLIVAVGSLVLLVSLFMDWYAGETAWGVFEVADVLLAALAIAALLAALGQIAEEIAVIDRGWLPVAVLSATVLVVAEILSPPPAVGGADPQEGAWIAFASALVMVVGTVLSLGRVSFSFAIEGRQPRQRVAAVDHRPPTTEAGTPVPRRDEGTSATEPLPPEESGKSR